MVQIISGIIGEGQHLFIGEVSSGLKKGLSCEICGSKLVAKKGQINEWHFAHENGNQRQDCLTGALNFIRRSVKTYIAKTGRIPNPSPFILRGAPHGVPFQESLSPSIEAILDWCDSDDSSTGLADIKDTDGVLGEIHVLLSVDKGPQNGVNDRSILTINVYESLGVLATQSVDAMCEQLVHNASAQWLYLPANAPSVRAANEERKKRAAAHIEAQLAHQAQSNFAFNEDAPTPMEYPSKVMEAPSMSWKDDARLAWAAELKEFSSIFCYQLKDGTQWFRYTTQTELIKLKPWPAPFDGCDECFPTSVGNYDERMQCYVIQDRFMFPGAFNKYVLGMSNTSNPLEIRVLFDSFTSN